MISAAKAREMSDPVHYAQEWMRITDRELTDAIIEMAERGECELNGKAVVVPAKFNRTEATLALENIKTVLENSGYEVKMIEKEMSFGKVMSSPDDGCKKTIIGIFNISWKN